MAKRKPGAGNPRNITVTNRRGVKLSVSPDSASAPTPSQTKGKPKR
jgi:hypothetical protein